MKHALAAVVACTLVALAPPSSNAQDDSVKLATDLVEVRAVVTDRNGRFVDGLGQEDFEVMDGGAPQRLSFFSLERITPGHTPDSSSSATHPVAARAHAARTVVAFVDDLHLVPLSLARVRTALKHFVERDLSDDDVFGLATASGRVRLFGRFGADRSIPLEAIDLIPPGPPSAWPPRFTPFLAALIRQDPREESNATRFGADLLARGDAFDIGTGFESVSASGIYTTKAKEVARQVLSESRIRRKMMLDSIDGLCAQLAGLPGQRLVLVYTDGFSLRDFEGNPSKEDLKGFASRAARSGVVVSTLVASGLSAATGMSADERYVPRSNELASVFQLDRGGARDLENGPAALAEQTGGELFVDNNDLEGIGRGILERNSVYYSLDYYSPAPEAVAFRDITVRVRNHPEYTVRAQGGYVPSQGRPSGSAPREGAIGELADALMQPVVPNELGVSASLGAIEPREGGASVTVFARVDGQSVGLEEDAGAFPVRLDVATVVVDLAGAVVFASSDHVGGALSEADAEVASEGGLRYTARVDGLAPGIYQARIGFRHAESGRVGAAVLWIRVPVPKK